MKIFFALLQVLPDLIKAILALKTLLTIPGVAKKEIIQHAIDVSKELGDPVPPVVEQGISLLVDRIVGTVKTAEAAQPPTPVPAPIPVA